MYLYPTVLLSQAETLIIQPCEKKLSGSTSCGVTYSVFQDLRVERVENSDVISKERTGAVPNTVEDIVDVQQEEEGTQNAVVDYTAGH